MDQRKIRELLAHWSMENETITDIVNEETGIVSDCVKYVGDHYVMKWTENPGHVKKAIEISKAFRNLGLVSADVIHTADGREYVEAEGMFCYLCRRIEGERLNTAVLYQKDGLGKARFIGEIIGKLSLALSQVEMTADDKNIYQEVTDWAIPTLARKAELDQEFVDTYCIRFGSLYGLLPKQMVHRDPNPGNIILSGDKWGVIDFDLSERNVRIYDPCYAASAILSESFEAGNDDKMAKWIEIFREIMYGYDSAAKLTPEETAAIPYVILANQFIAAAWFSEKERFRDIYAANILMTEWMIRNFDQLKVVPSADCAVRMD